MLRMVCWYFASKRQGVYHKKINAKVLKDWFKSIQDKDSQGSIIIMDNVRYHSGLYKKISKSNWISMIAYELRVYKLMTAT